MKPSQQKKPVINSFESIENTFKKKTPEIPRIDHSTQSSEVLKKMGNFSPMDLEKLNKAYGSQDQKSFEEIRKNMTPEQVKEQEKMQFFKRYKREEEEFYYKRKQEEEEKKRAEAEMELQKKQAEQERLANQGGELPEGKVRKNIFGITKPKANMKIPPPSTVEYKPSKGAQ